MEDFLPKWLSRLLSYIAAATYGMYAYASTHGHPVEPHRWVITGLIGLMMFFMSQPEKRHN